MQSVDDLIDALLARLQHYDILDDTYIFYSTDNGYHIGQHRLQPSKQCAFQEDVNIPLIIRGPGIAKNHTTDIVTTHTDLAPTFLTLAGATQNDVSLAGVEQIGVPILRDLDGSVIPLHPSELDQAEKDGSFGEHINMEQWGQILGEGIYNNFTYPNNTYKAVRIVGSGYNLFYTVWCTGDHELYDLVVS